MGLSDAVKTLLNSDTTLLALLTGGLYNGIAEISRQYSPNAFDTNREIKPCALIKTPADVWVPPYKDGSQTTIEIYFYQRFGYDTIEAAQLRVVSLLNRVKVGDNVWQVRWSDNVGGVMDNVLNCSLVMSRYHAYRGLS